MSRDIRIEAADLLACCASDNAAGIPSMTMSIRGRWRRDARRLARGIFDGMLSEIRDADMLVVDWYAEAEARLREAVDAG